MRDNPLWIIVGNNRRVVPLRIETELDPYETIVTGSARRPIPTNIKHIWIETELDPYTRVFVFV